MCSHKYLTIKPVYTTLCLYTKNTKDPPVFFPQNSTIHIRVTIKPVYTTLCLYTKIPKILLCFSTKHYDSYLKKDPHVFSQILNYKTCLYNFMSLHKKYQSFYKTLRFISEKKDPHVFSQILNYKTCLYNFVSLHKKYQRSSCVFPQNTTIHI